MSCFVFVLSCPVLVLYCFVLFLCLVFVSSVTSDLQECNILFLCLVLQVTYRNAISKSPDEETNPKVYAFADVLSPNIILPLR